MNTQSRPAVASFADLLDALQSGCQSQRMPELRGLDMEGLRRSAPCIKQRKPVS